MLIYYNFYYKFVKQYTTKSHERTRFGWIARIRKVIAALSKSWFIEEDRSNGKSVIRLPREYMNTNGILIERQ